MERRKRAVLAGLDAEQGKGGCRRRFGPGRGRAGGPSTELASTNELSRQRAKVMLLKTVLCGLIERLVLGTSWQVSSGTK